MRLVRTLSQPLAALHAPDGMGECSREPIAAARIGALEDFQDANRFAGGRFAVATRQRVESEERDPAGRERSSLRGLRNT